MRSIERSTSAQAAAAELAVHARNLRKVIDDRVILDDLGFAIPRGRYIALLGANGAGKSTLMRILSMLTPPSGGELSLFGQPLRSTSAGMRRRIGLISHQAMLYRDLSPRENLRLFGKLYGMRNADQRATQLLQLVNLADRADDPVKNFSRGMTQRTAIARALMHDPDLILADEPFAGLDTPSTHTVELLLDALNKSGRTILLANHDIEQSLRLAQQVLVLRRGKLVLDCPSSQVSAAEVLKEIGG